MRVVVAAAAVVAVCAVLGSCGGYRFPGGSSVGTGTVTGHVLALPCAPVVNPKSLCRGQPVPNLVLVFTSAGGQVVESKTDSSGIYVVELAAGTWDVTLKSFMRVLSGPKSVTVVAGGGIEADYVVDSGIRVPQPAA